MVAALPAEGLPGPAVAPGRQEGARASTTTSESFHQNTGIGVAFETGIDIKMFSSKITTTISLEMGYESQTSVTELQVSEVSTSINTAPGKAAALWQEFHRYVLYPTTRTESRSF